MSLDEQGIGNFLLENGDSYSHEQEQVIQRIMNFIQKNINRQHAILTIKGDAGTGKSVVLFEAFLQLQAFALNSSKSDLFRTENRLLVNHAEMLKIYRKLSETSAILKKKYFMKPTPFINQMDKLDRICDVVFIDEAHLLLTESDNYNQFHQENQLIEIIKHAKIVILIFDSHQVLKFKSQWYDEDSNHILSQYTHETMTLKKQYRIQDKYQDVTSWINTLTMNRMIVPHVQTDTFDFRIYNSAAKLYEAIQRRNTSNGLSRMLATTDYSYTVGKGKWYVSTADFKLPWDQLNVGTEPWALRPETIHEVGSIYTIQGFDLNYAGVIIGPGITYDKNNQKIIVKSDRYQDKAAFRVTKGHCFNEKDKQRIMLNALNVLLKRGRKGLYIYAHDQALREAFNNIKIDKAV